MIRLLVAFLRWRGRRADRWLHGGEPLERGLTGWWQPRRHGPTKVRAQEIGHAESEAEAKQRGADKG